MKTPIAAHEAVDARHISAFTRVFRRAMAGHDGSHPSAPSWPGLTPQVGFTRLAALNTAEVGQARLPMPSTSSCGSAKNVDARPKAGHDGVRLISALAAALYLVAFHAFATEPCDIPASLLSCGWDLNIVIEA